VQQETLPRHDAEERDDGVLRERATPHGGIALYHVHAVEQGTWRVPHIGPGLELCLRIGGVWFGVWSFETNVPNEYRLS
jgi:hypothetical protein